MSETFLTRPTTALLLLAALAALPARAAVGILAGRAATFDIAGARVSASPVIVPGGGAVSFSVRSHKD